MDNTGFIVVTPLDGNGKPGPNILVNLKEIMVLAPQKDDYTRTVVKFRNGEGFVVAEALSTIMPGYVYKAPSDLLVPPTGLLKP